MRRLLQIASVFLLLYTTSLAQLITTEQTKEPVFFDVKSHDPNIRELPSRSFYESRSDWQYIIDTTWGPGLPLANKRQIFNSYVAKLEEKFDGFLSLGFTDTSWNSLKQHYYEKINDSTSRGRFSAIMYYFSMHLHDGHTYAYDEVVVETPLNPGIPVLIFGHKFSLNHFGAVTTTLEDSTALVLRVVENHPLNLEPGDIILGYEGVLWKDLVQELIEAELPAFGGGTGLLSGNGGTTGSQSSFNSAIHITAGMNWHLFNTIDIHKHSTGETQHLSVAPLLNLNIPPMLNNEQLEIPSIPFPDYWNQELVTYGILPNSNIGYIYVFSEWPETIGDQQFYEAISALKSTDGLIIDMRWNEGGASLWYDSFGILCNDVTFTIDDAFRCSPTNWNLCPANTPSICRLPGLAPEQYERPIAVLLGPACFSMGDVNAYRLKYLPTLRTFGKPTAANLGWNERITNFPDWLLRYSKADMFHLDEPENYLNRKEFPLDYPIWFTPSNVANGYDTVVEAALKWINDLVYGHDVTTESSYASPGNDSITVSAMIENPNSSNITAYIYVKDLNNTLVDSVELIEMEIGDLWQGTLFTPNYEDLFKLDIKTTDHTAGDSFTIENVNRVTTAGPINIVDLNISYNSTFNRYEVKPIIKNDGLSLTLENLYINMSSDDTTITSISGILFLSSIDPQEVITHPGEYIVYVDSNFTGEFRFTFNIKINDWSYWLDSYPDSVSSINYEDVVKLPVNYELFQNYPNPFNPKTKIRYDIPERSRLKIKLYDVLGNEVKILINEVKSAGRYEVELDASSLSSGVYFYRLQADDYSQIKKMILLK